MERAEFDQRWADINQNLDGFLSGLSGLVIRLAALQSGMEYALFGESPPAPAGPLRPKATTATRRKRKVSASSPRLTSRS